MTLSYWQYNARVGRPHRPCSTSAVTEITDADGGKIAHYMVSWVSTRGEAGPWSETASAAIGAWGRNQENRVSNCLPDENDKGHPGGIMTGLEAYDALKKATSKLEAGSAFLVHPLDAIDLQKLWVPDLTSRGFDRKKAERVSSDLLACSLDELGRYMGLKLTEDQQASRLVSDDAIP